MNLEETIVQKAKVGCEIKILLMHPKNPLLPELTVDMEIQEKNLTQNFAYFTELAQQSTNIEVRQILHGIPHAYSILTDQAALMMQYLTSHKWGDGPLWKCTQHCKLYRIIKQEFQTLWDLNSALPI